MTTKIIYIANDGTEFDNEEECYAYEHQFDDIINSDVKFWDLQRRPLDKSDIENCLETCCVMYIPNQEIAKIVNGTFKYFGIETPWSDEISDSDFDIGYFYYERGWVNIDKEIASLNEIINSLK